MNNFGKCQNCGTRVTQLDLDNNKAFMINNSFVCGKCYFIYFERVKAFLEKKPGATLEEIAKYTGLPFQLINLYYNEGAIEKYKEELKNKEEMAVSDELREEDRIKKLYMLNSLRNGFDSPMHKVTDAKPMMRYFRADNNTKKR